MRDLGGPPDYEFAKDADITVLMWNQSTVKVNHAYKGELTPETSAPSWPIFPKS